MTGDAGALESSLAPNFWYIGSNGHIRDKEHFIQEVRGQEIRGRAHGPAQRSRETSLGETTILTGNAHFDGKFEKRPPRPLCAIPWCFASTPRHRTGRAFPGHARSAHKRMHGRQLQTQVANWCLVPACPASCSYTENRATLRSPYACFFSPHPLPCQPRRHQAQFSAFGRARRPSCRSSSQMHTATGFYQSRVFSMRQARAALLLAARARAGAAQRRFWPAASASDRLPHAR